MKSPKYDSSGKFVGSLTDILISAQSAYDTGDHVRADEILRQVLEAHPKVNAAWKLRGIIALKQGNFGKIRSFLLYNHLCFTIRHHRFHSSGNDHM